jgi:hypothetical protein
MKANNDLHLLVNRLITKSLSVTVHNKSFIVNDVPAEFCIGANTSMIASVIEALLDTVTSCAKNSCIRISAKNYGSIILLHIRDNNSPDSSDVAISLQRMQPLVEKTGGYVDITSKIKKIMTIAYSFSNLPLAA